MKTIPDSKTCMKIKITKEIFDNCFGNKNSKMQNSIDSLYKNRLYQTIRLKNMLPRIGTAETKVVLGKIW